jgi:hypothetical protein
MKWGMARNHFTSHNQRDRCGSSVASDTTGCWGLATVTTDEDVSIASAPGAAGAATWAPAMMRATEAAVRTTPRLSEIRASGSTKEAMAPTLTTAETPGVASAFMRTTDQSPPVASHMSSWVPGPVDDATQKPSSSGAATSSPPLRAV